MTKGVALGVGIGLLAALVVSTFVARGDSVYGQLQNHAGDTDGTVVVTLPAADGGQFVVVVDTTQRVIGSYQINAESGNIALASVRNYHWDFLMEEFNGGEPRPSEVRAIIEKR